MNKFQEFYKRIEKSILLKSRILEGGRIHTVQSRLGNQFVESSAKVKGTENLFPALYQNGQLHIVTYQLRRLCTVLFNTIMAFNGLSYKRNVENYEENKDFWSFVNMPSPPYFWGSANVVLTTKGKLLLGQKMSGKETYGGTLTPPAGIVETNDFVENDIVQDALNVAGLRELSEELGIGTEEFSVIDVVSFWDVERLKPQAFVISKVNHSFLEDFLKTKLNPIEVEFNEFLLVNPNSRDLFSKYSLSTEGLAAVELSKMFLD